MSACWVIERHDLPSDGGNAPFRYYTCPSGYFDDFNAAIWDGHWERALKFYDRASCEMICAEMPFEWDVRIMQHEICDDYIEQPEIQSLKARAEKAEERVKELEAWQPIETAPKDGSPILVLDGSEVEKVFWGDSDEGCGRKTQCMDWCIANSRSDEQGGWYVANNATHWKPLPLSPNVEEEK